MLFIKKKYTYFISSNVSPTYFQACCAESNAKVLCYDGGLRDSMLATYNLDKATSREIKGPENFGRYSECLYFYSEDEPNLCIGIGLREQSQYGPLVWISAEELDAMWPDGKPVKPKNTFFKVKSSADVMDLNSATRHKPVSIEKGAASTAAAKAAASSATDANLHTVVSKTLTEAEKKRLEEMRASKLFPCDAKCPETGVMCAQPPYKYEGALRTHQAKGKHTFRALNARDRAIKMAQKQMGTAQLHSTSPDKAEAANDLASLYNI